MKNKSLSLIILVLLVVSMIGVISTQEITKTVVAGKVYNADYSDTVSGANVNVTCTNNNSIDTPKSILSLADGSYSIEFTAEECALGDSINVEGYCTSDMSCKETVSGNSIVGSGTGDGTKVNIDMTSSIDLALGVSNIALIPEFGAVVGVLTILSALGVFFVIRRK